MGQRDTIRRRGRHAVLLGPAAGASGVLIASALTGLTRPAPMLGIVLLIASVIALTRRAPERVGTAVLAVMVAGAPAVTVVGVIHDRIATTPPAWASMLTLGATWAIAARTFGMAVARSAAHDGDVPRDVWFRSVAVGAATAFIAGAMVRHLGAGSTIARRLTWILGEEDNAHVVGVARELLAVGPRGEELAEQYGTAFMNVPLLILRLTGGPLPGDDDIRLQAITAFTVSTLVVILLAGLAIALLAALPHHVHRSERPAVRGPLALILGAVATGAVTLVAMSLLIVLPMRTAFLTFVWGLTLVLLAAACVAVLPSDASLSARLMVGAHLVATTLLLLSSWPFILPALLPLLLVPLLWVRWDPLLRSVRRHPVRTSGAVGVGLLAFIVSAASFARWGPAAEVLSYGRDLLTFDASSIEAAGSAPAASTVAMVVAVLGVSLGVRAGARRVLLLAVAGPLLGSGLFYLGLVIAARVLTGETLNYAGQKLLYGIITLALALGLTMLASLAGRLGVPAAAVVLGAVIGLHMTSGTAALWTDWWSRSDLGEGPHAVATIEAIGRTNDELPIRCLPRPDTPVTPAAREAIYYCVRWMEDAFNPGRFQGFRDELRDTGEETFGPAVEQARATAPAEYLFAYPFELGPGWYGWQGPGT